MIARVYINLLEGTWDFITFFTLNMIWSKHCFLGYAFCFLETCLVINGILIPNISKNHGLYMCIPFLCFYITVWGFNSDLGLGVVFRVHFVHGLFAD